MYYVEKDGFIIPCRYNPEKKQFEGYHETLKIHCRELQIIQK